MPTHVLRKSTGPWSAGTAVNIVSSNNDGTVTIEIPHVQPNKESGIDFEDLTFDTEKNNIVELRPRTRDLPKSNRIERRAGAKQIDTLIDTMMEKK